jgi:hypothetical protein
VNNEKKRFSEKSKNKYSRESVQSLIEYEEELSSDEEELNDETTEDDDFNKDQMRI